ncbi:hypothetical protein, partial [Bacillus sp. JJ864]
KIKEEGFAFLMKSKSLFLFILINIYDF